MRGKCASWKLRNPWWIEHFTHNFDAPMKSIKNFHFPKTEFETVFCQILHPYCHGVLRSLRKLVTRGRKYDWRGQKMLKLNINIKEQWKAKNGKLKEIIFLKFLSKYVSQFHLNQERDRNWAYDITLTGEARLNNGNGIGSLYILNYKYAVGLSPDFENIGIMALYCSGIAFDIQNFPIVPNRLDHCKIKTISRKSGLVAQFIIYILRNTHQKAMS